MMNKIRILCKYTGSRYNIIIGGIPVKRNVPAVVGVDEATYKFLKKGEECGWITITEDNYEEYCKSRLRKEREKKAKVVTNDAKIKFEGNDTEIKEEVKVDENEVETKEEVKAPKKRTRKVKEKE